VHQCQVFRLECQVVLVAAPILLAATPTVSGIFNYTVTTTSTCPATASGTMIVNGTIIPTLVSTGSSCTGSSVTYTTDSSMSSYIWTIPGTSGTNYTLLSGGNSISYTAIVQWLTGGSKTVGVDYNNSTGCSAASATSHTYTINSSPTSAAISDVIDGCNGGHTAYVNITGGTSPYTFQLSNMGSPYTGTVPVEF